MVTVKHFVNNVHFKFATGIKSLVSVAIKFTCSIMTCFMAIEALHLIMGGLLHGVVITNSVKQNKQRIINKHTPQKYNESQRMVSATPRNTPNALCFIFGGSNLGRATIFEPPFFKT